MLIHHLFTNDFPNGGNGAIEDPEIGDNDIGNMKVLFKPIRIKGIKPVFASKKQLPIWIKWFPIGHLWSNREQKA